LEKTESLAAEAFRLSMVFWSSCIWGIISG
jgi:hypothetical protein